jgi:putative FmdB family regulatory protein
MPIYEYRCGACGFQKEFIQRITDAPLTDCPECGARALNKLVTAAGFQLKGTGWYATDFRNKSAKQPAKKDERADKSTPAADSKSADSAGKEPTKTDASCGAGS